MKRSRRTILGLAAAVCAAVVPSLVPAAAQAGCGGVAHFAPHKRLGDFRAPLAIGDSVLLGAAEELAAGGWRVNVRGCRQMDEGLAVLRARARAGNLPRLVALALGSNWVVESGQISAALRILGPRRTLALVTPREAAGAGTADAARMRAAARRLPRRVRLLDWVRYSGRRGGMTYADGLHLTPRGQAGMARLMARALPLARGPRKLR